MKKHLLFAVVATFFSTAFLKSQTITCTLPASGFCENVPYTLQYTTSGGPGYALNNIFQAYLSDSTGGFSNPTPIGYKQSRVSGSITFTIPDSIAHGSKYVIKVSSTSPIVDGQTNGSFLTVYPSTPNPLLTASGNTCLGQDSLTTTANAPFDITWFENGNIVNESAAAVIVAGNNGVGYATNQIEPEALFVTGTGVVYVEELGPYNRVIRFPAGSTSATAGVIVANNSPNGGLYVDASGNVYTSNLLGSLMKFPVGSDSTVTGTAFVHAAGGGSGISGDAAGNIYVAQPLSARILMFAAGDPVAQGVTICKHGLNDPQSVFVTPNGNIYVADGGALCVWRYNPGGDSLSPGTMMAHHGLTNSFAGLYVDNAGDIYVCDRDNLGGFEVKRFPAGGDSSTVPAIVAGGNGQGIFPSKITEGVGVYLDNGGNIYVADQVNDRITKWVPGAPSTSFHAGNAGLYSVSYTNVGDCGSNMSDTVSISVCTDLSTVSEDYSLNLYPNPSNGSFILETNNILGKQFSITDMLGREVTAQTITSAKQNIALKNIGAGTYILKVNGVEKALRFTIE